MILQSLLDYYEILDAAGEISKPGYGIASVSYALNLSPEGALTGVIPLKIQVERGKKTAEVPQHMEVPERVIKTSGVESNFLCENSGYILGIDGKGKPERTRECAQAFRELHHKVLDGVGGGAEALLKFLDSWRSENAKTNVIPEDYLEEIKKGANIVFYVEGTGFLHNDPEIRAAWEKHKAKKSAELPVSQCLVSGKEMPVAILHPSIKGVKGAKSTGAAIVSFNARAYESYGYDEGQGMNAPVGEYSAFGYTTVLNHMLSDSEHRKSFGDAMVLYWAKSPNRIYRNIFAYSLDPTEKKTDISADMEAKHIIGSIFGKIVEGKPIADVSDAFDKDTRFYILGLSPNAARISIRFFLENSFGNILENIAAHYRDLEIEKAPGEYEYLPLWALLQETVSPQAREKASSPLLSGAVLRSILSGAPYPEALFSAVIVRIRAERDISRGKAAIIKACLLRKHRKTRYKEELTVSLNERSEDRAYILGRLFSALEKAQQDANPGINATIKDRYFTSACAAPATVFPILLRLSNHHISKSEYGYISERRIGELLDKLDVDKNPFPARLTLDQQGIFILGYYHQNKANFEKKDKGEK